MKKLLIALLFLLPASLMAQTLRHYQVEITTDAVNTTYTAGDVVGRASDSLVSVIALNDFANGEIVNARLSADTVNVANGTFRLLLLSDSTGTTNLKDNAVHSFSMARDSFLIGYIDFTLAITGSASGTIAYHSVQGNYPLPFVAPQGKLYMRLIATGAYVKKISGRFRIDLLIRKIQ